MLNEQGYWRLVLSGAIGLVAAAAVAIWRDPKGPITAGVVAALAAFGIDYFTERKEQ